jgi:hypothetical protein
MAIKQDCMNKGGMARWVALNLYFGYVGLRGFPYSDAEYIDKCDAVAAIICDLDSEEFVYEWFQEKPMPRRGEYHMQLSCPDVLITRHQAFRMEKDAIT